MQAIPYLYFDGNCKEAFESYAKLFNAEKPFLMPHTGTPAESMVPPEFRDKILHARLAFKGGELMASDAPPGRYRRPQGYSVSLIVDSAAEAERLFQALSEGGSVFMPLAQTFFAERFGMLTDRFNIPWMINYTGDVAMAPAQPAQ